MPLAEDFSLRDGSDLTFDPLPPGQYHVQVEDVAMRKVDQSKFGKEPEDKLTITFRIVDEGQFYGRKLWSKDFTPMLSLKSKLYESGIVPVLLGRPLTQDDIDNAKAKLNPAFWNGCIGKNMLVMVVQKPSKSEPGKMVNMIVSYFATDKDFPPFDQAKIQKSTA